MFAAGKGYLASLVAVAGVLFGNGFLYVGARRFYSQAMQRRRDVLVLFALMLCLMNVGNFLCYVPVRTFATHADMATLEKGLHASPWWIITVLGIPLPSRFGITSQSCCPMPAAFSLAATGFHKSLWLP